MKELLETLNENTDGIWLIVTSVVAAFSAVAAITPTPRDDGWAAKTYKVVDWLALNVIKAKDK